MNYKLFFIFFSFMLLFFSTAYAEFDQKSDALGLVVMQAEAYDSIRAGLGSKTGETFSLEDSIAGYFGDGYMQSNMAAGDGNASNADTIGIRLTYVVNFVNTGPQYVWARALYRDGQSDSFFWGSDSGVNGQCARGSDWRYGEWYWYRADSSAVIDAPGTHTINFYGREPDARLDMIMVTSSDTFNPNTDLKDIVVVHDPAFTEPGDQPLIDTLVAEGYNVTAVATGAISAESQGFIDVLNDADLVIMGRSINSGTTDGADKPVWNGIEAPMLVFSPWCVRSQRLGWFNSSSCTQVNDGDTLVAIVTMPGDDVFSEATITDDKMAWATGAHDFIVVEDAGNGTSLAISEGDSVVLFARFDPYVYFFNGSADYAAGYRTYIGNGNDAAGPVNFFNFTDDAATVFLKEVARMTELPEPPEKPVGIGKEIVVVHDPAFTAPGDSLLLDALAADDFIVTTVATGAISEESQGFLDTLNNADVVIMGRSINSGTTDGADKPVWNGIEAPMLVFSPWCVRSQRLGWFNSSSCTQVNDGDSLVAIVTMPGDDVFSDATITDDKMLWATGAYDYIAVEDAGNGTSLAISEGDSVVLFARFDPYVYFFDGSADYAAGYRTYIGNGNDAAGPVNFFNFTDDAATVFLKEIVRLAELPEPPEKPVGIGKEIVFVSYPNRFDDVTGTHLDSVFIADLLAQQYIVDAVYSTSLETASQGLVDTLNSADLVIIGRSASSGDFGDAHKPAWNAIRTPMLNLQLWAARTNRMNWLPTGTTTHNDALDDTLIAKIELPDDPVFADATIATDDSTMDWAFTPTDYMETTDGGNGTVLARDAVTSNVLFVRWDAWAEFYEGAGDTCAGYRTLIGNGNDHVAGSFNYYNFTDEAKQVYLNEVARMVELDKPDKPVSIEVGDGAIPMVYALGQNYPNPFNPTTNIKFSLPKAGRTTLKIYNTLGQLVSTIVDKDMNTGVHTVSFRAGTLSSGIYFYRIESGDFINVKKMMLLK